MQQKSKRELISIKVSDITYARTANPDEKPTAEPELLDVQFDAVKQMIFVTIANGQWAEYQAEGSVPQAIAGKLALSYAIY